MPSIEHDVFICCREEAGQALAATIAASLSARGFHVIFEPRVPGAGPDPRRLSLIEGSPDFVLVLTPGLFSGSGQDPVRAEVVHAIRTGSAILTVTAPGYRGPDESPLPPDLAPLVSCHRIAYNPSRRLESLEMIAHALSSDVTVDDRRLMRWAKRGFVMVGLVFLMVVANEAVPALYRYWTRPVEKPPLPPFAVYWSAYGQRQADGRWSECPIADAASVSGGDQLRLVFSPSAEGYAYVVVRDTRGEVSVLFPSATMRGASRVRPGTEYEAPAAPGWLTVDAAAGLETIYILAGYDPLENMEELLEDADSESSVALRRDLVESTVQGLIDGRHGAPQLKIWNRDHRQILRTMPIPEGPATSSLTLFDGTAVQHRMIRQAGMLSAAVELRLRFEARPAR